MFDAPFFVRAVIASSIMGLILGLLSSFIVINDLAFAGLGITHAIVGGIGLGFLIGLEPTLSIILSAVLIGLVMASLKQRRNFNETTAIGIMFPITMALGIIALSLSKRYTVDLLSYLFGNILLLSNSDLYIAIIFAVILFVWFFAFLKEMIFISFDCDLAYVSGVNVRLHQYIFMLVLSLSVAISSKLVGLVLVSALTVIPGATALLFARSFPALLILSACFGLISAIAGIILSFLFDIPPGASIICLSGTIFFFSILISKIKK